MIRKTKREHTEFQAKQIGGPQPAPWSLISARIVDIYGDSSAFAWSTGVQSSFFGLFSIGKMIICIFYL